MYQALEGVHQLAAVGGFGLTVFGLVRGTLSLGQLRVLTALMTVLLVLGVIMTADRWSFGEIWILISLVLLVEMLAITGAVLTPAVRRGDHSRVRIFLFVLVVNWIVAAGLMLTKVG